MVSISHYLQRALVMNHQLTKRNQLFSFEGSGNSLKHIVQVQTIYPFLTLAKRNAWLVFDDF